MYKLVGLSLAFGFALSAGCSDNKGTDDAGIKHDGGVPDLMVEGPPPDMAPAAFGTQIVAGAATLSGLNDDDQVFIYTAKGGTQLVPLAGGTPTTIDTKGRVAFVHDKVIFSLGTINTAAHSGTLSTWSAAGGLKTITAKSALIDPAADKTAARIIYSTNISLDSKTTDIAVNDVGGGDVTQIIALPTIIAPSFPADGTTDPCSPILLGGGTKFLVGHCNQSPGTDMAVTTSTLSVVDATTGAATTLLATLKSPGEFNIDDAHTKVLAIDALDRASVYLLDGSTSPTMIDGGAAIKFASLTPDGTAVVYVTSSGEAKRLTLGGAITPLATSIEAVRQIFTPDFAHLFYSTKTGMGADGQPVGDVLLISTAATNTPITFESAATGTFFGPGFTTDGSKVAFYTDIDANSSGTLKLAPAAGGTAATVAPAVWSHQAASGAKLTYLDAFDKTNSRGDLKIVDGATGTSTLVGSQVEERYFLTKAKDKIVYGSLKTKAIAGIYVAPVQ